MYKILIIDDSKSVQAFLKDCLKTLASEVHSEYNGKDGLKHIQEKGNSYYDLIFLDWEMPELNGPDTYQELKKIDLKTPVIMITTKNKPEEIMQMLDNGVAEYVMKPFTQDIIEEKIYMVLK